MSLGVMYVQSSPVLQTIRPNTARHNPTNPHPSSTIFACVRASSLGLAVSDLSWVYCWAAIWGNIELGFGILGAVSLSPRH